MKDIAIQIDSSAWRNVDITDRVMVLLAHGPLSSDRLCSMLSCSWETLSNSFLLLRRQGSVRQSEFGGEYCITPTGRAEVQSILYRRFIAPPPVQDGKSIDVLFSDPKGRDLYFREMIVPSWRTSDKWHHRAAAAMFDAGRYDLIREPDGKLLVFRAWLQGWKPPTADRDADTANATLLHWLVRADSCRAMHSHPWPFASEIIAGDYAEEIPAGTEHGEWVDDLGPRHVALRHYKVGDIAAHDVGDLHRIAGVGNDTWTIVRTGARVLQPWGFHPAGQRFQPASGKHGHRDTGAPCDRLQANIAANHPPFAMRS